MPKNVVPNPVYYTHTVYTYILKVCTSILLTQAATVNSSATQSYSTCDYISSHWAAISPPRRKATTTVCRVFCRYPVILFLCLAPIRAWALSPNREKGFISSGFHWCRHKVKKWYMWGRPTTCRLPETPLHRKYTRLYPLVIIFGCLKTKTTDPR